MTDARASRRRGGRSSGERATGSDRRSPRSDRRPTGPNPARLERAAAARAAVELPAIVYPPDLPVSARRDDIAAAIRDHQVVIVAGETGSGKTTQIPKIALELGRGRAGQIGHTQPRRIAARSVAERIAEELGTPLGEVVGYQVRFTDESSPRTLVRVMTDGILLAQIQRDPMLLAYDTLIVDEAHERSLTIDFILGYLARLLPQRPDLHVIITSATIDSERFARHFASAPTDEHPDGVPAPVIEVTGRTYPVEVRYRPLIPDEDASETEAAAPRPKKALAKGNRGAQRSAGHGNDQPAERDEMTAICEAVDELCAEGPGDILVFCTGEREIRDAAEALRGHLGPRVSDARHPQAVEVLPLYGRLSAAEQHRVFESHAGRRIVLSTNVAETSLTVPGIRYVIDTGTARISRYSKATKVQRLPIEPISQASAAQRSGRCGRVADGIAIRLYSEADFDSRPEFTEPEILRTSLAAVILQMMTVGVVTDPEQVADFPFVDQPDVRAVRDGVGLLTELGALGPDGLTEIGRSLALLPMDPRQGRMIVEAQRRGVLREVMIIAAALSIQDPRERPSEQRELADASHARFADPSSDLLSYLNLWRYLTEARRDLSGSAFRRLCKGEFLHYLRVREWQDLVGQLEDVAKSLPGMRETSGRGTTRHVRGGDAPSGSDSAGTSAANIDSASTGAPTRAIIHRGPLGTQSADTDDPEALIRLWDGDAIHRSILAGLLSQIGMQEATEVTTRKDPRASSGAAARNDRRPRNEYLGPRGARFAIFPGSRLAKKPPAWVMAAELVETSRLWARDVARIRPEWVEEQAPHLVKRSYSEPHWSTRQGAAMATERVLLYGLPVVTGRPVLWATVDPTHARELFIRHALVQGEWTTHHRFFAENRRLLEEAAETQARARRHGLVVDDDVLETFYEERIPADIVSARHFDRWWRDARRATPDLLTFTPDMLLTDSDAVDTTAYPSQWPQGDLLLDLDYRFEPGRATDGVSVQIPLVQLPRVQPDGFDWLVPGMLTDLVAATIRALPKQLRVQLVPAPDVARDVVAWIEANAANWQDTVRAGDAAPSFRAVVAQAVRALRGVVISPDDVDETRIPDHLRMRFVITGPGGAVIESGDDLVAIQRRLAASAEKAVASAVRSAVAIALEEAQGGKGKQHGGGRGAAGGKAARGATARGEASAGAGTGGTSDDGAGPRRGDTTGTGGAATGTPADLATRTGTPTAAASPATSPLADWERPALTTWPADLPASGLPPVVEATAGGLTVRGYPALVESRSGSVRGSVTLQVLADAASQADQHRRALARLLLLDVGLATARVTTRWSGQEALTLAASPYPTTDALVTDVQLAALDAIVSDHLAGRPATVISTAAAWADLRTAARETLEDRTYRVVTDVVAVLAAHRGVLAAVRDTSSIALLATLQDVRNHAAQLVTVGFVRSTGAEHLRHVVRYLRADEHRIVKAAQNPNKDAELAWRLQSVEDAVAQARDHADQRRAGPATTRALAEIGWMVEELRVSLFAQQLGTVGTVSEKRIRAAITALP